MQGKIRYIEYILFAEAWLFLAMARVLLIFCPFKKIVPLLGKTMVNKIERHKMPADPLVQTSSLHHIQTAIARGCRYSFWRTMCFEQALAARMMLKKRGLPGVVYFGVYKNNDGKLNAHAWVESSGIIVTGGRNTDIYTVITTFSG